MYVQSLKVNISEYLEHWDRTNGQLTANICMHELIAQPLNLITLDLEDACY